jgi:hypothetical protein
MIKSRPLAYIVLGILLVLFGIADIFAVNWLLGLVIAIVGAGFIAGGVKIRNQTKK